MKILAFESSAKSASVCLLENGKILAQNYQNIGATHSKTLLPMAENLLNSVSCKVSDVDYIAVAHGPGSYTGVRIGVAVVQGLCLSAKKPCVGVSTLEAMAYNFLNITERYIVCLMDARASQIYGAIFVNNNQKLERVFDDSAISIEDFEKELKFLQKKYIFVGDGAEKCYNILKETSLDITLAPEHLRYQNAFCVGQASLNYKPYAIENLLPNYLRLSQAEREKQEKNGEKQ
ncbi:MAG: tRNA (adenosine(37)-N6)-threonylcarbamoyltransferase complex dimerization subunit type 1 TsaB [Clostridia bacterium]